ncbi:MAG TPA: DUF3224 domain-containing protein [Jatrophihabitans sp.]|jgi:hypothetical protein
MTTATVKITGKTWDESREAEVDAEHAIGQARFTTEWAGDISGSSICWLLISYIGGQADKPETLTGPYLGYEQVRATIGGRSGTFVLAASGSHTDAVARTDVRIVPGSGTGDFEGIGGSGSYAAEAMEYILTLDYEL